MVVKPSACVTACTCRCLTKATRPSNTRACADLAVALAAHDAHLLISQHAIHPTIQLEPLVRAVLSCPLLFARFTRDSNTLLLPTLSNFSPSHLLLQASHLHKHTTTFDALSNLERSPAFHNSTKTTTPHPHRTPTQLNTYAMAPDINSIPHLSAGSSGGRAAPSASKPIAMPAANMNADGNPKQPNILFIMADQLAAPLLKMYNPDSRIKTPNLDALAARSVQFDSAYCPSPLCAPSRMSLITGQLPMKIGAFDNASQIASDVPTYAHYLRLKNYHTVLAGKMHFIGDQLHGYETRLTSDIYPGDYGWAVNWDEPDRRLEWYHNASSILQAGTCVRSNQLDYDEEVMYRSTQFLYDQVREGTDRPFALTVSRHKPWNCFLNAY